MRTKVFIERYKGQPVFSVWEVDNEDKKVGRYPAFSFGKKKAELILSNIAEIEKFVASSPAEDDDLELPF